MNRRFAVLVAVLALSLGGGAFAQEERSPISRFDADGDGKLSREEVPEGMARGFDRIDANRDGFLDAEELSAARAARGERGEGRGEGRPGDGPGRAGNPGGRLPDPDHANLKYGDHERNVVDLWLAKSERPTPLVIYFHGGGFRVGDKRSFSPALLDGLRAKGISVAAANYRLTDVAPFPAPMHDGARALQFLREHAEKYNLDPARFGAIGGSAGAGISLWLAFHDDLADPKAEDPVKRRSSRLAAVVGVAAQASYDPRFIGQLFDTKEIHPALLGLFGMESPEDVADEKFHAACAEASPITHVTKDDPPVFLYYPQPNEKLPPGSTGERHIHHPKFGFVLKEKLEALKIACEMQVAEGRGDRRQPVEDYVAFFAKHLLPAAPKTTVESE